MSERSRVRVDPAFSIEIPPGWVAEADEEEGVSVYRPDGVGLLHLTAFPDSADAVLDPAEELYAFLEENGIEIEEDEVEDLELARGGEMSLCEYIAEDEEDERETTYWLVAVAVAPGNLVFANYTCPAGEEDTERSALRDVLISLDLMPRTGAGINGPA